MSLAVFCCLCLLQRLGLASLISAAHSPAAHLIISSASKELVSLLWLPDYLTLNIVLLMAFLSELSLATFLEIYLVVFLDK